MKEKLAACFDRLQRLEMLPTVANMELLLQTLYDIREIYNGLPDPEKGDDECKATG